MALDTPEAAIEALENIDDESFEQAPVVEESQDNFSNIDPATLSPELKAIYNNMQGDYTRKTQEVAGYRKLADQYGVTPEQLELQLSWISSLSTDVNAQRDLYTSLKTYLEQNNLLEEVQAAVEEQSYDFNDVEDEIVDPRLQQLLNQHEQELAELRQWREQQAIQENYQRIAAQLDIAEAAIRRDNPSYSDEDIDDIYTIAHSTNGDLAAAQQRFEALRQRWASGYINQKGQAPQGLRPMPTHTEHAEQPQTFDGISDPRIRDEALARLRVAGLE